MAALPRRPPRQRPTVDFGFGDDAGQNGESVYGNPPARTTCAESAAHHRQTQPEPQIVAGRRSRKNRNLPRVRHASASTQTPFRPPSRSPAKPGYVFSPFDPSGGYVDVTGYTSGQKVKDPYSGKIFLVP